MTFDPRTSKNVKLEIFPQEVLDLHTEVRKHPDLMRKLHDQEDKDVYIQILEIATHCEIAVAGTYTHADMLNLCKMLTEKLHSMRSILVVPIRSSLN
jgi:hypothetical protein